MRVRRPGPLIAAVAFAVALLAHSGLGQRLETLFSDTGARILMQPVPSDVVIVGIDAGSIAELERWPWPRRYHAELIERLAPSRPAQLFIDIDFSSPSNDVDDAALEAALANWPGPPAILPAFLQYASGSGDDIQVSRPVERLRPYVSLASANLAPAADGLVRFVPLATDARVDMPPPVATQLHPGHRRQDGALRLDFAIDPSSFRYVSFADVIANRVPAETFADKTVFVGATAIELGDMIPVPVHRSLPGVAVQALAYESARRGGHASVAPAISWTLVAAWAAVLAALFCRLSWRRNLAVLALSLLSASAAVLVAGTVFRTVLPFMPFAFAAIAAWALATLRSLESETLRALAYAVGLRRRGALLQSIVLSSSDGIVCVDAAGRIKTANPAAATLFGYAPSALPGMSLLALVPSLAGDSPPRFDRLADSVREHAGRTSGGEEFPVELSFSRVRLTDQQLYTAIMRDISERKAQQRQLQFQATHDPLTNLPNRAALSAHLDSLLAASAGDRVALLMIDLDRFKEVNDTLGHNVGDYVLYEVARRLERTARGHGFIARIGGDEFALVVDRCDGPAGRERLSRLSRALVDCLRAPIETCGFAIDVGLSIGIAACPDDARDAETLFKNADVAMYVAKRSASGFEYYDAGNDFHSVRKLTIAARLRQAIAEGRLALHYQPKVDLRTDRVTGAEALLRWHDAELGTVGPEEFIALAESTDMIRPLTDWTVDELLRQLAGWRSAGIDLRVAVNVSARILQDGGFPARLDAALRRAGIPAANIELEITESAMMNDPRRALQVIRDLASLGATVSIDDFGTGYSSLAYLRDLPVHALKLDKSFVAGMQQNEGDRVIVASTVQMAHAMKLEVVAEGVESAADAATLQTMGYDYAQGYWYSAALPADAFADWLRRYHAAGASQSVARLSASMRS